MEDQNALFLNTARYDLCRRLVEVCKSRPNTPFNKIRDAKKLAKEIDDFDAFVLKYFQYRYNPTTYTFEKVEK